MSPALGVFLLLTPAAIVPLHSQVAAEDAPPLDPALIRARCAAIHAVEDQSLVFGHVLDARTRTPLPGATVHLSWATTQGVSDTTVHRARAETADGAYIFCDVPQRTRLTAWADALGRTSGTTDLWFEGGESERRDLVVSLEPPSAAVAGQLVDDVTGAAIEGARVAIVGTDAEAVSDREGRFRLPDLPSGALEATIRHIAYGEPTVSLIAQPGRTTFLELRLAPEPVAVEPIAVTIEMRPRWLEAQGFYHRAMSGLGEFVMPTEIERRPWRRFSEVLRVVPGIQIRNICRPHCFQVLQMSTAGRACTPTFYVDGKKMTTVRERILDLDALAPSGDLAAVEVYRGASQTPPQYYGLCGSIVIWTKRGAG